MQLFNNLLLDGDYSGDNFELLRNGGGFEPLPLPVVTPPPPPVVTRPPPLPPPIEQFEFEEDVFFFSLPFISPQTGQGVITPHVNARTGELVWPGPDIDSASNVDIDSTQESDTRDGGLMGTDDPFAIVADVARQLFAGLGGGGGSAAPVTTYVPVMGGSGAGAGVAGGGSMLIVLIVLALIGGGAWWYFKGRKSNAAS